MVDGPAHQRFRTIAQKWRDLAERRRDYFADMYRSGRWKRYYTEQDFVERMREVADSVDLWADVAPRTTAPHTTPMPQKELTVEAILAARRRDAA